MTLREFVHTLTNNLLHIYTFNEAKAIAEFYTTEILSLSKNEYYLFSDKQIDDKDIEKLNINIEKLIKCYPVQYVLGYAYFYNYKFYVDNNVLIPRQETEIIIDYISKINNINSFINILDIGTGTGCIAITIKKLFPNINTHAIDISEKAINMCLKNAKLHKLMINTAVVDILSDNIPFNDIKFNMIVSNPPYVLESEKKLMHKNVVDFEPEIALYVKDSQALIFYEKIAKFAINKLYSKGIIIVEINEQYGKEVISLFNKEGFSNCKIIKDLNNKDRFVVGNLD